MRIIPILLCLLVAASAAPGRKRQVKKSYKSDDKDIGVFLSSVYGETVKACKAIGITVTFNSYYTYMIELERGIDEYSKNISKENAATKLLDKKKNNLKTLCNLVKAPELASIYSGDYIFKPAKLNKVNKNKVVKGRRPIVYSTEEDSYSDEYYD